MKGLEAGLQAISVYSYNYELHTCFVMYVPSTPVTSVFEGIF